MINWEAVWKAYMARYMVMVDQHFIEELVAKNTIPDTVDADALARLKQLSEVKITGI